MTVVMLSSCKKDDPSLPESYMKLGKELYDMTSVNIYFDYESISNGTTERTYYFSDGLYQNTGALYDFESFENATFHGHFTLYSAAEESLHVPGAYILNREESISPDQQIELVMRTIEGKRYISSRELVESNANLSGNMEVGGTLIIDAKGMLAVTNADLTMGLETFKMMMSGTIQEEVIIK